MKKIRRTIGFLLGCISIIIPFCLGLEYMESHVLVTLLFVCLFWIGFALYDIK